MFLWVMGKEGAQPPLQIPHVIPQIPAGTRLSIDGVFQAQALEVNIGPVHNFPQTRDFKSYLSHNLHPYYGRVVFVFYPMSLFCLSCPHSLTVSLSFPLFPLY